MKLADKVELQGSDSKKAVFPTRPRNLLTINNSHMHISSSCGATREVHCNDDEV